MIFPFKTEDEAIHLANITDFVSALPSGAVTSSGPVALPARSSLEWYLSMISPAPILAHRSEASRLQVWARNLALPRTGTYQSKTDLGEGA